MVTLKAIKEKTKIKIKRKTKERLKSVIKDIKKIRLNYLITKTSVRKKEN